MPMGQYTGDYNYSRYTPVDSTGSNYDPFKSAFRNIRFNVQPNRQVTITSANMVNLPGIAYQYLGDTSLWDTILAYNGLTDPISDVVVGVVLNIPLKADIIAYVSKQSSNQTNSISI